MKTEWRQVDLLPAIILLFCLVAASCSGANQPAGTRTGEKAPGEIIVAEGCDLSTTADLQQQELIRTLLGDVSIEGEPAVITIDYPDDGSVFPPDMISPTFLWHDRAKEADSWLVEVSFADEGSRINLLVPGGAPPIGEIDPRCIGESNALYEPTPYQASAMAWQPSADVWQAIKANTAGSPATVTLSGFASDKPLRLLSRGSVQLSTSLDPVDAPIFYRDVPLMPSTTKDGAIKPLSKGAVPLIAWRLRDVSRKDSRLLLEDMPTCANCHSFSADGRTLGMDIDGPNGDKGAYGIINIEKETVIEAESVISWNSYEDRPEGHITLGFLSRMSPDGSHVITTVNESLYVQNFMDYRFCQVFYPTRGVLAHYSRETGEINLLPGADDQEYVYCDPVWTPDGETIIFARARARDPYPKGRPRAVKAGDPNETPMRYDLFRMPWNGGLGGVPVSIEGASANGMSNTFPKVSPDGKWIVFVKCANGQLMRPDGRLWIIPVEGGKGREMNCNQTLMNSWHSFSPNGRWVVFSSKANTPYTQMFLTHIGEKGDDTPALLIEGSTLANRAVNIPEFVNIAYDDLVKISVPAVDHWRHLSRGAKLSREGNHQSAVAEFTMALEGEMHEWRSNDWKTHANMGMSLLALGRGDEGIKHLRRSLELKPNNPEAHTNLGYALARSGNGEEALEHLDAAVQLNPRDAKTWFNLATMKMNMGDKEGALEDYTEAIRVQPDDAGAYNGRGTLLMAMGDLPAALSDFNSSLRINPNDPTPWYFRAMIRNEKGDLSGAAQDAREAMKRAPAGSPQHRDIEALLSQIGR